MICEADLHVHSTASDGTFTPTQVVEVAAQVPLRAVALCDHDTTDGIDEATAAGERLGVEVVPGVEINTEVGPLEIHILGYFFDKNSPRLKAKLDELKVARISRCRKIVRKLRELGIPVDFERVIELAGSASVGRPHIARVICETGHADSINSAFGKYLVRGAPAFVQRYRFSPEEAIELIISAGGVAGLAHPAKVRRDDLIPQLIRHGLRAIEVHHGDASSDVSDRYLSLARKLELIPTGGSDAHGIDSTRPNTIGSFGVAYDIVERLRNAAGQ